MDSTRDLLLAEQRSVPRSVAGFSGAFRALYPELKGDLQHLMLACERRDTLNFNLTSIYHGLMVHLAEALNGIAYSGFNSLADYEQDLGALGFPDLLSYLVSGDLEGLHRECQTFDRRLQRFLTDHSVALNAFGTLDELQQYLEVGKAC